MHFFSHPTSKISTTITCLVIMLCGYGSSLLASCHHLDLPEFLTSLLLAVRDEPALQRPAKMIPHRRFHPTDRIGVEEEQVAQY